MSNINCGVIRKSKKPFLKSAFFKVEFDLKWYDRKYIDYMLKIILIHPNLAINAAVFFQSLFIVDYHNKILQENLDTYMNLNYYTFNSD